MTAPPDRAIVTLLTAAQTVLGLGLLADEKTVLTATETFIPRHGAAAEPELSYLARFPAVPGHGLLQADLVGWEANEENPEQGVTVLRLYDPAPREARAAPIVPVPREGRRSVFAAVIQPDGGLRWVRTILDGTPEADHWYVEVPEGADAAVRLLPGGAIRDPDLGAVIGLVGAAAAPDLRWVIPGQILRSALAGTGSAPSS